LTGARDFYNTRHYKYFYQYSYVFLRHA